jgi:hypothetical protein
MFAGLFFPASFGMSAGTFEVLGGVFISYRREDSGGYAGRIYDRLTSRLGRENVFFDVDAIPPGRDFVDVLSDRVGKCDALLAVIGKHWVASADGQNRRRLDDPNDFVRIEIEAALQRDVPVIPVLVDGAPMPQPGELPDSLKKLTRRQAIEISLTRFDSDAERLTDALSKLEDQLRRREAAGHEPPARTVEDEAHRSAPERPTQVKAAASTSIGASLAAGPTRPEAPLAAPREQTKPRSFVVLAILGLAIVAGIVLLLARLDRTATRLRACLRLRLVPSRSFPLPRRRRTRLSLTNGSPSMTSGPSSIRRPLPGISRM